MKKAIIFGMLFFAVFNYGQKIANTGSLIQGGVADGEKLLTAYLTPINKAIVFGLSDVTYTKLQTENDAKKFSLSVKLAYISIPDEDKTYDISALNMQTLEAKDPTKHIAQSVFGDSIKTVTIASKSRDLLGRPLFEFESSTGGQKDAMPLPQLDFSYRMKGTSVSLSFIPYVTVPSSDMKVGMIGASVQHDISSVIKSLENKPFSISLQSSFAYLAGAADLDVKPDGVTVPVTLTGSHSGPYDNQEVKIKYTSIQLGAYFDYTIKEKYTLFAGTAFNTGSSKIKILGTYPVYSEDPSNTGAVVAEDIYDPITISQSFNRMKLELGARADWDSLFLQLNYNIATYGGLGLNLGYKF